MKQHPSTPEQLKQWKMKIIEKSGTFLAILVLNIFILVLLGSTVIYHLVVTQMQEPIATFKVKPVPPPPKPPAKGGDSAKSLEDASVKVIPPPASLPSVIVSPSSLSFNIRPADAPALSTVLPSFALPVGSGLNHGTTGGGVPEANPFGALLKDAGTPAIVGYFYDLKQTSDDPPKLTGISPAGWRTEMDRLLVDNLDEGDLSKYLKSSEPRTTNGFSIPEEPSRNAPTAFGLGDKVQPNLWAIIYHGKASVPEAGRYRFVGFGDDVLYIKLNGRPVFDGGWQALTKDPELHSTYPYMWSKFLGKTGLLRKGEWFNADQGDVVKLDIVIGDRGGLCGFFLMLEKDGATYDKAPDGITPKLPLFQMGAKLPYPEPGNETPPLSDSDVVWPAVSDDL